MPCRSESSSRGTAITQQLGHSVMCRSTCSATRRRSSVEIVAQLDQKIFTCKQTRRLLTLEEAGQFLPQLQSGPQFYLPPELKAKHFGRFLRR
jgi:hypothetical protein